jgi:hypothetical protein
MPAQVLCFDCFDQPGRHHHVAAETHWLRLTVKHVAAQATTAEPCVNVEFEFGQSATAELVSPAPPLAASCGQTGATASCRWPRALGDGTTASNPTPAHQLPDACLPLRRRGGGGERYPARAEVMAHRSMDANACVYLHVELPEWNIDTAAHPTGVFPAGWTATDSHDVVAKLAGIGLGHRDILPAHPNGASQLRCHLFVHQTHCKPRLLTGRIGNPSL